MSEKQVSLKLIEGKNFVDVEASVQHIKQQLENVNTIEVIAKGIEISRVAIVIRRVEEECNCLIAKMQTVNSEYEDENGKKRKMLEFHTKFIKRS